MVFTACLKPKEILNEHIVLDGLRTIFTDTGSHSERVRNNRGIEGIFHLGLFPGEGNTFNFFWVRHR